MKVYLVCQEVDLGYHVHYVFLDKEKAEEKLDFLIKNHYSDGWDWNPKYFIEDHEAQ